MKIGFIGLGKMGLNMVARLLQHQHEVVAHAQHSSSVAKARQLGAEGADTLENLISQLPTPRVIWLMVPAGEITRSILQQLSLLLSPGDIIIDGGNSFYKDSVNWAQQLLRHKASLLDVGTSGGIWGREHGYCFMVGGDAKAYKKIQPLLQDLAAKDGYAHVGPSGAGHFVKMIHNGIEYGMLQAYGEGFALLNGKAAFDLDLAQIAKLWEHGSVVRSWLLELTTAVFKDDAKLEQVAAEIADSGEGKWAADEALEQSISAPIITMSLLERFRSRDPQAFSAKLIASLRHKFGGHKLKNKE